MPCSCIPAPVTPVPSVLPATRLHGWALLRGLWQAWTQMWRARGHLAQPVPSRETVLEEGLALELLERMDARLLRDIGAPEWAVDQAHARDRSGGVHLAQRRGWD